MFLQFSPELYNRPMEAQLPEVFEACMHEQRTMPGTEITGFVLVQSHVSIFPSPDNPLLLYNISFKFDLPIHLLSFSTPSLNFFMLSYYHKNHPTENFGFYPFSLC
ncbi:hypothetical protein RRG08_059255 [Elysia crispata]|uniref:Uncharacterized protein n=1 Tax=Elysia crispata TaxID=231223 RepID=A0AAE0Y8N3_9GAST|nr:hypothetical protein RRG08_059255 [Elysia crispata]